MAHAKKKKAQSTMLESHYTNLKAGIKDLLDNLMVFKYVSLEYI